VTVSSNVLAIMNLMQILAASRTCRLRRSSIQKLGDIAVNAGGPITVTASQQQAADWLVQNELCQINDGNKLVLQSMALKFATQLASAKKQRSPRTECHAACGPCDDNLKSWAGVKLALIDLCHCVRSALLPNTSPKAIMRSTGSTHGFFSLAV
jgi:hypothetical protein